jgi:hypothetical protein
MGERWRIEAEKRRGERDREGERQREKFREREKQRRETDRQGNRGLEIEPPKEMIGRDRERYRREQIYCTHIVTLGEYLLAAVKDRISHFFVFLIHQR